MDGNKKITHNKFFVLNFRAIYFTNKIKKYLRSSFVDMIVRTVFPTVYVLQATLLESEFAY